MSRIPMEGVGDVVAWATGKLGITPCPECLKRKEYLNTLFPFRPTGSRLQGDGTLIFPIRGSWPKVPEGYRRTLNPYILKIKLEDCPDRKTVGIESGCCGVQKRLVCQRYNQRTDALNCKNCQNHKRRKK